MRVQHIVTICDIHAQANAGEEDEQVLGQAYTFTINGSNPISMDMCGPCFEEHAQSFLEVLADFGQEIKPARRARTRRKSASVEEPASGFVCPDCNRSFAKEHGLATHRAIKHKAAG